MAKYCKAIDHLVESGVFEPIATSELASPLVMVGKKDGTIRLCGDYKGTVTLQCAADVYPLPR